MDTPRPTRVLKILVVVTVCFSIGIGGAAVGGEIYGQLNPEQAVTTDGTIPLDSPNNNTVYVVGMDDYQDMTDSFTLSGTVNVITEHGNATFFSSGETNSTVQTTDLEGTWTNVTEIDADPNTLQIDPEDKGQVTVGQEIQAVAWRDGIAADDGTVDFSYVGNTGTSRVTVSGVAADTRLAAIDASSNQILDTATSTSGGAATFDELDDGDHDVQIQAFDPAAPELSNPAPTGETASAPTEVSVDVADGDFPQGDSVDVTIDVDGSQVHTETISSNQTVTASVPSSAQTGGDHTWSVEASDDYGETTTDSYSYAIPKELEIYDEETVELIDDQQVNLTVYTRDDTPEILTFNTSSGTVDLGTGFPATEPFVVVAESDGYLDRRIFVQSVYQSQDLYLLNESTQHTDVIFQIEDYTGDFPPDETTLELQRGINGTWTTVLGDYFGANDQFEAQLRYNERHRLVLVNAETGDRRVLGTYTPLASGTETISVSPEGGITLPDKYPTISFEPSARTLPEKAGVSVSSTISAGDDALDDWSVSVYHLDGGSNTTLYSESGSGGDGGSKSATLNLDGKSGQVKVVTSYSLDGSAYAQEVAIFEIAQEADRSMTIIDGLLAFIGVVPSENTETVTTLIAMILVVVGTAAVGTRFRLSTEGMGMVTLVLVTVFAIFGWLPYSLMFTLLVLFASLAFLRRRY